jgi:hypothetical protein
VRYTFGLVGLLVGVAVLVWAFAENTAPMSKVAVKTQDQARQMAGRDEATGESAADALALEPARRGGKVIGMRVKTVAAGSAMQKFYGLHANDVITQAGDLPLAEPFGGDEPLASGMILEAYKASKPLEVQRGGQKLTLPQPANAAAAATPPTAATTADPLALPAATPAPSPAQAPAAPAQPGGLQRQLDIIRNSGGQ